MKIHPRFLLLAALATLPAGALHAQTTMWTGGSGTWSNSNDWTNGVPTTRANVVFGTSTVTTSVDDIGVAVSSATYSAGAPLYNVELLGGNSGGGGTILGFLGTGIVNNSSQTQQFTTFANPGTYQGGYLYLDSNATISGSVQITNQGAGSVGGVVGVGGVTYFQTNSTAGSATIINNPATSAPSATAGAIPAEGGTTFLNTSSAASANIVNQGSAVNGALGGVTAFADTATASHATITNQGSAGTGALGSATLFYGNSTANSANIVNQPGTAPGAGGGTTSFRNASSAGSATLTLDGGSTAGTSGVVVFQNTSDGGTARTIFNAGGALDISALTSTGMNLGSIEGTASYVYGGQTITGAGTIGLGSKNLSVGGNNASTTFNGSIADGGAVGGTGGSLTKAGTGTLSLTGASTYTGGTTVSGGGLLVNNTTGSATGSGAVAVSSGTTLGGNGSVAGSVTVASGGFLVPGNAAPGTLSVGGNVALPAGAGMYTFVSGTAAGSGYGQVKFGGTLTLGGSLNLVLVNNFTLTPGMTFTILEGTGTGLVSGTFSNTAAGGTIYADSYGDSFLVNYAANTDGGLVANDVTLTVLGATGVPEPGTWALVVCGAGALAVAAARRVRRA